MTSEQREQVEKIKAERAKLTTPAQRIAFDNDPANGTFAMRIVAAIESERAK